MTLHSPGAAFRKAVKEESPLQVVGAINANHALLAKRAGCQRTITLVNSTNYAPLIGSLGIDAVVSPRATTLSNILQHVRRGGQYAQIGLFVFHNTAGDRKFLISMLEHMPNPLAEYYLSVVD